MIPRLPSITRTALQAPLAALLFLALATPASAFTVPPNDGFVTDVTGTLTAEEDGRMEELLRTYREETTNEIAVLVVESLSGASINETGLNVGRAWGVGTEENDNGILILLAVADREVAILTGYGLEGAVPDIVAKGIIEQDMMPRFRQGEYYQGLMEGINALRKHIGGEYTAKRYLDPWWSGIAPFFFFILFVVFNGLGAFLGRTKSWWLGGVLGGVLGLVFIALFGWWLAIPVLAALGLLFDYIVSKMPSSGRRGGRWGGWGGGGFGGRGGGGFGGGSFGGGGASGRW